MGRWFWGVLGMVGVLGAVSSALAAEGEPKTMEELLVEKGVISKDEAAGIQGRRMAPWVDRVTFSGDLRLRHESFWKDPASDRHRQRIRLRFGPELKIGDLTVGIRVASGTGEQTSANQSFDNLFSPKGIWIDRAYLRWQGSHSRWLTLTGGKMPNPFFTVYSSDAMWDEEVNPEGLAENVSITAGQGLTVFLNLGQFVLDEDSTGPVSTDQWLFGQQIGVTVEPSTALKTTWAVAYYNVTNAENNSFGQPVCNAGNTRAPGTCPSALLNDYNVLDLTGLVALKVGSLPLSLMGDYLLNTTNPKDATGAETDDSGYQVGTILGRASEPKTWELAYFYKRVGTDATLADIADADFGHGGTDQKGHITWLAYSVNKALVAKAKFFQTEQVSPGKDDVSRLQAEVIVKF